MLERLLLALLLFHLLLLALLQLLLRRLLLMLLLLHLLLLALLELTDGCGRSGNGAVDGEGPLGYGLGWTAAVGGVELLLVLGCGLS